MQKIVIIGATSGIGLHLARLYATAGHLVGGLDLFYITRRWWLVAKLFRWIPGWVYYRIG